MPPPLQAQIKSRTEAGVPMVSLPQFEAAARKAKLSPEQTSSLANRYSEAQIQALKRALLWASAFVLVGVWFARALPAKPITDALDSADASV